MKAHLRATVQSALLLAFGLSGATAFAQDPYSIFQSSQTNYSPRSGEYQGKLAFSAYSPTLTYQLWFTDGTAGGTAPLIPPGSAGGANYYWIRELNGWLLFGRADFPNGFELWRSDGTMAGTSLLVDFTPGSSWSEPQLIGSLPGILLLSVTTPGSGRELWRTDGTSAGTVLVLDIHPGTGNSNPGPTTANGSQGWPTAVEGFTFNGELYFGADDGVHGRELWATDGTSAGTHLVADINPGTASSNPSLNASEKVLDAPILGNELYFLADDGQHGRELFKTDGSAGGTQLVADINPGPACVTAYCGFDQTLWKIGSQLCFVADDSVHGLELWRSDGTAAGTYLVMDIQPGTGGALLNARLRSLGTSLLLTSVDDGVHGWEEWGWDGGPGLPSMLADLTPGSANSIIRSGPLVANGVAYLSISIAGAGVDLWRTDGTSAGTWQITNLHLSSSPSYSIALIDKIGSRLLFGSYAITPLMWIYGLNLDGIGTPLCTNTGTTAPVCPCANNGRIGRGCANSDAGSLGARLEGVGTISPDTVELTATEVLGSALSIFLQGSAALQPGVSFGDGVRCVGGTLKRLYAKNASGGVVIAPQSPEPSISARSAALGDVLLPGATRHYQVYYRDSVLGFCPAPTGDSWNITGGVTLVW